MSRACTSSIQIMSAGMDTNNSGKKEKSNPNNGNGKKMRVRNQSTAKMRSMALTYKEFKEIISESIKFSMKNLFSNENKDLVNYNRFRFKNGGRLIFYGRENKDEIYFVAGTDNKPWRNKEGKIIVFRNAALYNPNYFTAKRNGRYCIVDSQGKYLFGWLNLGSHTMICTNDMVLLEQDGKYNWGRLSDETVLFDTWFDYASPFKDYYSGFSMIKINGKGYNLVDTNGKLVFSVWFSKPIRMAENGTGVAYLDNNTRAYIDKSGRVIPLNPNKVTSESSEGLSDGGLLLEDM